MASSHLFLRACSFNVKDDFVLFCRGFQGSAKIKMCLICQCLTSSLVPSLCTCVCVCVCLRYTLRKLQGYNSMLLTIVTLHIISSELAYN